MGRKRRELPIIEGLEIVSTGRKGKAVARHDGMVIFVEGAAPGDICDVKPYKKRKKRLEARIQKMISPSAGRVAPECTHFGTCGGCKWQHLSYELQLKEKTQHVTDALERIGKVEFPAPAQIIGSKQRLGYRNKLEFTFGAKRWLMPDELASDEVLDKRALGYHIAGNFEKILHIDQCLLQQEPTNAIRNFVDGFARKHELSYYNIRENHGLLRNLTIRITRNGSYMILVSFAEPDHDAIKRLMDALRAEFPACHSLLYVINQKKNDTIYDQEILLHSGEDHIVETLNTGKRDLKFRIGAKSFFQTNPAQAEVLYSKAVSMAEMDGNELVYDLYCGAGSISLFIADNARKVIGVEIVPEAIVDANKNKALNGIENVGFHAGDMKDLFNASFIEEHGAPDLIFLDPPRAGLHSDVVSQLIALKCKRIIYISCDPSTQARDLGMMNECYSISEVQPVDMFPQTYHIENIVRLDLR